VLDATRVATEIVLLLQQYYADVILPVVSRSVPEHSSASSGLAAFLRAVEDTTLVVLRKCVDAFFAQVGCAHIGADRCRLVQRCRAAPAGTRQASCHDVLTCQSCAYTVPCAPWPHHTHPTDPTSNCLTHPLNVPPTPPHPPTPPQVDKVLYSEQRKADFLPKDTSAIAFDKPTAACLMVTAMLAALRSAACDSLSGANLSSFLEEVGMRMHQVRGGEGKGQALHVCWPGCSDRVCCQGVLRVQPQACCMSDAQGRAQVPAAWLHG
jgi:hypothetical protein